MKNKTILPLYPYPAKVAGIALSLISMLLAVLVQKANVLILPSHSKEANFDLMVLLTIFGLVLTASSEEKTEDERTQKIRSKANQVGFYMMLAVMFGVNFTGIMSSDFIVTTSGSLSMIMAAGLVCYLYVFHVGLYNDPEWVYNDDNVLAAWKKNRRFYLIYSVAMLAMMVLLFIL